MRMVAGDASERSFDLDICTLALLAVDLESRGQLLGPLSQVDEPEARSLAALPRREPAAVVLDPQDHPVLVEAERDENAFRSGMPDGVGDRLLADAEEVLRRLRREGPGLAREPDLHPDRTALGDPFGKGGEGSSEVVCGERWIAQVPDGAPGRGQALVDQLAGAFEVSEGGGG